MPEVTIQSSEGSFIDANSPTTNQNDIQLDTGHYTVGSEKRRSLVSFDLSSIPAGSTINSVTLRLYLTSSALSNNNRTIRAYRIIRDWHKTQCTWNVYTTGNNWGTAGCGNTTTDRESAEIGSKAYSSSESAGWKEWTFSTSKVAGWVNGTFDNNGILLKSDSEVDDMQRHAGNVSGTPPELVIDYTPPPSSMFLVM